MEDRISIVTDGREITGRVVFRSSASLQVEITSASYPFRMSASMYVAPTYASDGLFGTEGALLAESMLAELDRLTLFLECTKEELISPYRELAQGLLEAETESGLCDVAAHAFLDRAKVELLEGRMTGDDFKREVTDLRERNGIYHRRSGELRSRFFRNNFPFPITPELQHQVLLWIGWQDELGPLLGKFR